jgi:hypothetical protein
VRTRRLRAGLRAGATVLAVATLLVAGSLVSPMLAPTVTARAALQDDDAGAAPVAPDPILVEGPHDDLPPELALSPAVQRVEVGPRGARVTHRLAHGLDGRLDLALAVTTVEQGPDGAPLVGEPIGVDPLRLPADRVVLDPGEAATITSAAAPGTTDAVAVTATPHDGEPLVAYVVLVPGGHVDDLRVELTVHDNGEATAIVTSLGAPTVANVGLEVRGPVGPVLVSGRSDPVLLLADAPRALDWQLELPPLPFPVTVTVTATPETGPEVAASTSAWLASGVLIAVATALLVVSIVTLVVARRRRRRRDPHDLTPVPTGTDDQPAEQQDEQGT